MKASELKKKLIRMRDLEWETERKMIAYRDSHGTGIAIGEIEARAMGRCCNILVAWLDDMVYDVEVEK